jgi:hypothetical protein
MRWRGRASVKLPKHMKNGNRAFFVRRLNQLANMQQLLRLHGIRYEPIRLNKAGTALMPWMNEQRNKHYVIPVFQTEALGVFQHLGEAGSLVDVSTTFRPPSLKRMKRLAARCLYAIGLDLGCMTLRMSSSNSMIVVMIDPSQGNDPKLTDVFNHAINVYKEQLSLESSTAPRIMLGMDPEFILRNEQGKIVPASKYLNRYGGAGYDSATVLGRRDIHPLAELRPEPSEDPALLVRNLRRAMWKASMKITDKSLQWLAGGMPVPGLPLGGHVHMSGIYVTNDLIRALDNYMTLPLVMIEDLSTGRRRRKYGFLGDIRHQPYGGFEYRTLPSWIVSPQITKGVLALAKLIAENYRIITMRPLDHRRYVEAYVNGDKMQLAAVVEKLWLDLEALDGYKVYEHYLNPLKQRILQQKAWNEQSDFRVFWRIPPFD